MSGAVVLVCSWAFARLSPRCTAPNACPLAFSCAHIHTKTTYRVTLCKQRVSVGASHGQDELRPTSYANEGYRTLQRDACQQDRIGWLAGWWVGILGGWVGGWVVFVRSVLCTAWPSLIVHTINSSPICQIQRQQLQHQIPTFYWYTTCCMFCRRTRTVIFWCMSGLTTTTSVGVLLRRIRSVYAHFDVWCVSDITTRTRCVDLTMSAVCLCDIYVHVCVFCVMHASSYDKNKHNNIVCRSNTVCSIYQPLKWSNPQLTSLK